MPTWLSPDALLVSGCVGAAFLLYSTIWKDYVVQAFGVAGLAFAATVLLQDIAAWGLLTGLDTGVREALTFGVLFLLLQLAASRSSFVDPFEIPTGAGRLLILLQLGVILAIFARAFWPVAVVQPVLVMGVFSGMATAVWWASVGLTLVFFGKK